MIKQFEENPFLFDLENLKLISVIEEVEDKFELLGLLNEREDNNSELAGFEINKLLKEQSKLERRYNDLIQAKNKLQEVENREKLENLKLEIEDIGHSLKESTKKLCRLFKENKNLGEDVNKVRSERQEIVEYLVDLKTNLLNNQIGDFNERLVEEMKGQNELRDLQASEKEILSQIKSIKFELLTERKQFQTETSEKNITIKKLQDEYNKSSAEINVRLNYQRKEVETKCQTESRMLQQKEELLKDQIKEYERLLGEEEASFNKVSSFFQKEGESLKQEVEVWSVMLEGKIRQRQGRL